MPATSKIAQLDFWAPDKMLRVLLLAAVAPSVSTLPAPRGFFPQRPTSDSAAAATAAAAAASDCPEECLDGAFASVLHRTLVASLCPDGCDEQAVASRDSARAEPLASIGPPAAFDSAGAHALAKARRLVGARSAALDAALGGVALSPTLAHEVQAPVKGG